MNNIICYINSNYIDIKKDNEIIHIVSNSINEGDIINKELFINDIKNKKIFSNIITNKVDIYINHIIKEKDIIYYKLIFEDLNSNNINIYDTSNKLISPTLIECNNIYILYYKNKYYKIIPELLNEYLKIFKVNELRIISNNKIPSNNKVKYYYYNSNNIID